MDADKIKEVLSENDIMTLLEDLGAEPQQHGSSIICRTICHHGHKHKLIYNTGYKTFHCFTGGCGTFDIFGLVGKSMELDFADSFRYVASKFGLYGSEGFSDDKVESLFFQKFKRRNEIMKYTPIPESILGCYYKLYHRNWVDDGISVNVMKKYGIRFSILTNQIIIPHYDRDGNLIGVRARNLNIEDVKDGRKYMPIYHKGKVLKHLTGGNLYGLNVNQKDIEKYRVVIIFESEKSVLQLSTMFPDMCIGVAASGSTLTPYQLELLKELEVDEVIIALDKEYEEIGSDEEKFYAEKIKSVFIDKLSPYFKTSVLWDTEGLLSLKDSPTDRGMEIFTKLLENRIYVSN